MSLSFNQVLGRYLSRAQRSEGQVREFLVHKAIPDELVESLVATGKRLGYIDDQKCASSIARGQLARGKGQKFIAMKLQNLSIKALPELDAEELAKAVQKCLQKKSRQILKFQGSEQKLKAKQVLYMAGFTGNWESQIDLWLTKE